MNDPPLISIITVVYNNAKTIAHAIDSVKRQDYPHVEHIVIDGCSTDGTSEIVKEHEQDLAHYVCEPDKGMYDAMNKGICLAKGDFVGILNADDFYEHAGVLGRIAELFEEHQTDAVIADIQFVSLSDPEKIVRYYSSSYFRPDRMKRGFMPAHPTFYVRRELYQQHGMYKTHFKIAADYELLVRFFVVNNISYHYAPEPFVRMRTGGASNESWKIYWTLNTEVVQACRENGVRTNLPMILSKYVIKLREFLPGARSRDSNASQQGKSSQALAESAAPSNEAAK